MLKKEFVLYYSETIHPRALCDQRYYVAIPAGDVQAEFDNLGDVATFLLGQHNAVLPSTTVLRVRTETPCDIERRPNGSVVRYLPLGDEEMEGLEALLAGPLPAVTAE